MQPTVRAKRIQRMSCLPLIFRPRSLSVQPSFLSFVKYSTRKIIRITRAINTSHIAKELTFTLVYSFAQPIEATTGKIFASNRIIGTSKNTVMAVIKAQQPQNMSLSFLLLRVVFASGTATMIFEKNSVFSRAMTSNGIRIARPRSAMAENKNLYRKV